jgi:hypothetical protein
MTEPGGLSLDHEIGADRLELKAAFRAPMLDELHHLLRADDHHVRPAAVG